MEYADLPGRDARGNWKPVARIELPAFPRWPFRLVPFLQWLFGFPGFLWPYKAVIFGLTAVTWFFLTPPLETMATLRPGWIAPILLRNVALKAAHYVHHRNVSVGPWSGISMHPIESLIYFSYMFVHLIVPSHPLHAIFHLQYAGLSPAQGHTGFSKMELGHEKAALAHGSYFHYLHHRYFECNYASDEDMFLDKLFGSMHDGTAEAHAKMRARAQTRIRERKEAAAAPLG